MARDHKWLGLRLQTKPGGYEARKGCVGKQKASIPIPV